MIGMGNGMNEFDSEKWSMILPDQKIYKKIRQRWDALAKPLDGLGRFEEMTARIGAVQGSCEVSVRKRAVIVMCADNGVVAEGVSQSGQEVTAAVAESMGKRESSVCRMAKAAGTDVIPVDIGIAGKDQIDGVISAKIARGTRNFAVEPAMTRQEAAAAIETGIRLVRQCKEQGYELLATGEMGIGNTTTSSAMAAALLHLPAATVTGRGAGLSSRGLEKKIKVIEDAIARYQLYEADAFTVLKTAGGLDIAGLTGVFIGGAVYHIPIVLDGLISSVAALTAQRLVPGVKEFMLASHAGKEPAASKLLEELGLSSVIYGNLALGEGTGAIMLFPLLDLTLAVYHGQTVFSDLSMEPYQRLS